MAAMRTERVLYAQRSNWLTLAPCPRHDVMPSHASHEHLGLLLGFVGMAIFGGTLPATRIAVSAIDPLA